MIDTISTGRRGFVVGAAGAAVASAVAPVATASEPTFGTMLRNDLNKHVNTIFQFKNELGEATPAKLVRVEKLNAGGRRPLGTRRDVFSAVFEMDGLSSDSEDQTMIMAHPKLGSMHAFVQPIHRVSGPINEVEVIFG